MIWVFLGLFLVFSPSLAMYVMNYDYCNGAKYSPAPARSLFSKHKLTASCKLQLSVSICEDKPLHYPGSLSCRLHTVSSVLLSPPFAFSIPFLWGRVSVVYKHILEQIAWSLHQNDASTRGSYPSKTILWETNWLWPDVPWSPMSWKRHRRLPRWQPAVLQDRVTPAESAKSMGPRPGACLRARECEGWEGRGQGAKPEEGHGPGGSVRPFCWAIAWTSRKQGSMGPFSWEKS